MIFLISWLIWNIKVFFHSSCPDESFKKGLWCEKDWAFNSCLINDVFPWKESWPSSEVRGLFPVSCPSKVLTHIWPKKLTKMFVNRGLIGCNVRIGNSNLEIWSDAELSAPPPPVPLATILSSKALGDAVAFLAVPRQLYRWPCH